VSLEAVRKGMRGLDPVVVTEAPAGCGKTHEAADLARDLAERLPDDREVLVLAHTNAAVEEFRSRASRHSARVRALTLDAFALELIVPYATQLGLPSPLRPGRGGVSFSQLATRVGELFTRAPSILRAVAAHYPVMILDEHQDSRVDQHDIVDQLRRAGPVLVRVFGDPMQAIYAFDGALVDWDALAADKKYSLTQPRRWKEEPALGEWLMAARDALRGDDTISREDVPASVQLTTVEGLSDPGAYWKRPAPQLLRCLRTSLTDLEGTVGVLVPHNSHALGIRVGLAPLVSVYEGAEPSMAYEALEAAIRATGRPRDLAHVMIGLVHESSTGLDKQKREALDKCLRDDDVEFGRRKTVRGFAEQLAALYESPDIPTFCAVAGSVCTNPPPWLKIHLPEALRCLAQVDLQAGEDPIDQLAGAARYRKLAKRLPRRCVTTIHKSKGREFDHVIIPLATRSAFPDGAEARKLLYVAMTRSRRSIQILLPASGATPLLVGSP